MNTLTVGKVASATGLSNKAIRYYESEGLIPKAQRSAVGYRLYTPSVITRLNFIQKAKNLGFSLEDIRGLIQLSDRGCPCCEKVIAWSEKKLAALDEQIQFLQGLRAKLSHHHERWKQIPTQASAGQEEICSLIDSVEFSNQ
jgi:MerR family transcriptional regulator, copper efflux regulator